MWPQNIKQSVGVYNRKEYTNVLFMGSVKGENLRALKARVKFVKENKNEIQDFSNNIS